MSDVERRWSGTVTGVTQLLLATKCTVWQSAESGHGRISDRSIQSCSVSRLETRFHTYLDIFSQPTFVETRPRVHDSGGRSNVSSLGLSALKRRTLRELSHNRRNQVDTSRYLFLFRYGVHLAVRCDCYRIPAVRELDFGVCSGRSVAV